MFAISFSAIFVRLADVSPGTSSLYRGLYALPLLLLLFAARRWRGTAAPRTVGERAMALGAGLLMAIDLNLWHRAIGDIGAGLSTVIANLQAVFVPLATWLIFREKPPHRVVAALPIAFAGVALAAGVGTMAAYGDAPLRGALYSVAAAVAYTGFLLLLRRGSRQGAVGPLLDVTLGIAVGGAALAFLDPAFDPAPFAAGHGWLVALAVGPHILGWLALTYALPRLPAALTSFLLLLQPCLTLLWSVLLFAEAPSWTQWLGAAAVLGAVLWTSLERPSRSSTSGVAE